MLILDQMFSRNLLKINGNRVESDVSYLKECIKLLLPTIIEYIDNVQEDDKVHIVKKIGRAHV